MNGINLHTNCHEGTAVIDAKPTFLPRIYRLLALESKDYFYISLLFIASLLIHGFFIIKGLGEADAGRLLQCAVLWHITGDAAGDYSRVSPLYNHIMKLLLDWDIPIASLPSFLNWFSVVFSSITIIPLYLLWKLITNRQVAFWGSIFLSFSPAFWLASIAGMPHLPAFTFFLFALLLFLLSAETEGKLSNVLYLSSITSMMIACSFKADIFLCGPSFVGILFIRKRLSLANFCKALVPTVVGVVTPIIYYKLVSSPSPSAVKYAASWSKEFLFTPHAFITGLPILNRVNGPLIFFVALIACVAIPLFKKEYRSIFILTLLWVAPTVVWWGFRDGNSVRHMMMAFSIFPYLCSLLISSFVPSMKYKFIVPALCLILIVVNYISIPPSGDAIILPSTQLFASKRLIQKGISGTHDKAKTFAMLNDGKKAFIGTWTNPYTLFEVFANAEEIGFTNRSDSFSIKNKSGTTQDVLSKYVQISDATETATKLKKDGWTAWSQEYDLNQLTEKSMAEDMQATTANLIKIDNPGFEKWGDAGPSDWLVRQGQLVKMSSSETSDGKLALEIPPGKDVNYVYQSVPLSNTFSGKKVFITAMSKAFEPNQTALWAYTVIGTVQSKSVYGIPHPGDGKWHRIGISVQLPEKLSEGKVSFVLEGQQSTKPSYFDDVQIYLK